MYDRVVSGRVVTPAGIIDDGWVALQGARIAAVGSGERPAARDVASYGEAFVLPGAIDGQTHAGSQIGFPGLASTTRAALAGGVTTIVDMPYDEPDPITTRALLDAKIEAVHDVAVADVALYGTVPAGPKAEDIAELVVGGVCAFKISAFEAHPHRFPRIGTAATLALMDALSGTGLPIGIHNEDQEIVRETVATFRAAGKTGPENHTDSRPEVAEIAATATFLSLGTGRDAHLHIVHISTPAGFEVVRRQREAGQNATAEMCVHYLHFDAAEDTPRLGGLIKVNPPIRAGHREALWRILESGGAAFVSSDHSAWPLERKTNPSILDVAAGMPGLDTLLPVFFTGAAKRHGADRAAAMAADLLADRPARFFGLSRKGRLAPGMDADIAILAPEPTTHDSRRSPNGPGWSAYDGETFAIAPVATYVRGRLAWDGSDVVARPGTGHYIPRG